MYKQFLMMVVGCGAMAGYVDAQTYQRRASFLSGRSPGRGKCTIEVVVDTAADVEIRGDHALLRTIAGQPAQWRRFECTSSLPQNPTDFRFEGIDGRGSQQLIRNPRNGGGVATIRIEDPKGGAEGYTFDILWSEGYAQGRYRDEPRDDRFYGNRGDGRGRRFSKEQAVQVCESSIMRQAMQRFHTSNIHFRRTALDDNPGRQDWVIGLFDVRRSSGREEAYRFACSVNFDNGLVRSAQIGERLGY